MWINEERGHIPSLATQAVYSLSDTNWVEIDTFQATADNGLWFDTEPANQASKFYKVLSLP